MRRGRPQRGKLVAVHPRLSLTGVKADEWVPIRPGTYAALALGMANVIINSGLYDADFVRDFTFGFEDFTDAQGVAHMGFRRLVLERYPLDAGRVHHRRARSRHRPPGRRVRHQPAGGGAAAAGSRDWRSTCRHGAGGACAERAGGLALTPRAACWCSASPIWRRGRTRRCRHAASLAQPRLDAVGADPFAPLAPRRWPSRLRILAEPYPLNALLLLNANPVYESPDGRQDGRGAAEGAVRGQLRLHAGRDGRARRRDPAGQHVPGDLGRRLHGRGRLRGGLAAPAGGRAGARHAQPRRCAAGAGCTRWAARWRRRCRSGDYKALCEHACRRIDTDWDKLRGKRRLVGDGLLPCAAGQPGLGHVVGRDRLHAPKDGRFDFFSRELYRGRWTADGEPAAVDLACLPGFTAPAESAGAGAEYPFLLVTQAAHHPPRTWQGIVPTLQESYGLQGNVKWRRWVEISPQRPGRWACRTATGSGSSRRPGRVQAAVRLYGASGPTRSTCRRARAIAPASRGAAAARLRPIIGANVNQLLASEGVTRVRIYKA